MYDKKAAVDYLLSLTWEDIIDQTSRAAMKERGAIPYPIGKCINAMFQVIV